MCDTKKCTKCSRELPLDQFYARKYKSGKEGWSSWCKLCTQVKNDKWHKDNPEKVKASGIKWQRNHPNTARARNERWRKNNPEKIRKCNARNYRNNRKKRIIYAVEYERNRMAIDSSYKLMRSIRSAIYNALIGNIKSGHTIELLGCSIEYLRQYLENQFIEDMTWDNYGKYGWHIDHILPLSYFDFTDPDQQKRAWHYTNLRPLWAVDNMQKGNKIEERQLILL